MRDVGGDQKPRDILMANAPNHRVKHPINRINQLIGSMLVHLDVEPLHPESLYKWLLAHFILSQVDPVER